MHSLQGTTYIYGTFFKPYISQHENEIERNLLELRARASDVVIVYFQKAASVGQSTFFDVLKYVASQSPSQKSKQQRSQVRIVETVLCFFQAKLFTIEPIDVFFTWECSIPPCLCSYQSSSFCCAFKSIRTYTHQLYFYARCLYYPHI